MNASKLSAPIIDYENITFSKLIIKTKYIYFSFVNIILLSLFLFIWSK